MGSDRAPDAGAYVAGSSAPLDEAGTSERDLLRAARWHCVAADPKGSPSAQHDVRLLQPWRDKGLFGRINHTLVMADRERSGHEASPTAALLDSQSVKTSESGGPRGYDAGKKVKGRKRQALVDTDRPAPVLHLQAADIQDRDGVGSVLRLARRTVPFIVKAFADAGYAATDPRPPPPSSANPGIRSASPYIAVHPRRWVVERYFGWISFDRRPGRTRRRPSPPHKPSSTPPPSRSSSAGSAGRYDLSDGH